MTHVYQHRKMMASSSILLFLAYHYTPRGERGWGRSVGTASPPKFMKANFGLPTRGRYGTELR